MRTVRIKGYSFQISTPFQAGSVITEGEAQALNSLRIENVSNNLRDEVSKAIGELPEGALLSAETLAELQTRFTKYERAYVFLEKHQPRPRKGIIEAEALIIAEEKADAEAQTQGRELSPTEREALVEDFCQLPAVMEEARARAAAKQQAMSSSLEDLLG